MDAETAVIQRLSAVLCGVVALWEQIDAQPMAAVLAAPGNVRTDLTGNNGYMTAEEGARLPVEYALF